MGCRARHGVAAIVYLAQAHLLRVAARGALDHLRQRFRLVGARAVGASNLATHESRVVLYVQHKA